MIEPLVDDSFNRVVVLGFNRSLKLRRGFHKFANVALVTAAKSHHVNFLAVRANNVDLAANERVHAFPCRDFVRRW